MSSNEKKIRLTISPDNSFAFVGGPSLQVFDTESFAQVDSVPIAASGSLAFMQDGIRAYVPVPEENAVYTLLMLAIQERIPTYNKKVANRWKMVGCGGGGGSGKKHYACVDDAIGSPNNDEDFIEIHDRRKKEAIFGFSLFEIPFGATIQFVRVNYVAIANFGSADIKTALRVNGNTFSQPTDQILSSNWEMYSYDWETNPQTSAAWTVEEINGGALEGMGVVSGNGDESVTQVYITVGFKE